MTPIQVRITIESFDFLYLYKASKNFQKIISFLQIKRPLSSILPSKLRKYTVERSPHIDKKSREQFETKRYKAIFEIVIQNTKITQLLFFIFKNSVHPGVQISITARFQGYLV